MDLDLVQDPPTALRPDRRLSGKQPSDMAEPSRPSRSYALAWTQYVRGGIVTEHARCIIVQFMAANSGKSGSKDLEPDDDAAQRRMNDLPENSLPPAVRAWHLRPHVGTGSDAEAESAKRR